MTMCSTLEQTDRKKTNLYTAEVLHGGDKYYRLSVVITVRSTAGTEVH